MVIVYCVNMFLVHVRYRTLPLFSSLTLPCISVLSISSIYMFIITDNVINFASTTRHNLGTQKKESLLYLSIFSFFC